MINNLIYLQDDISSTSYNIQQDLLYIEETKKKMQKEFEKTLLYKQYIKDYKKVELLYIDEDTIEIELDGTFIELNTNKVLDLLNNKS